MAGLCVLVSLCRFKGLIRTLAASQPQAVQCYRRQPRDEGGHSTPEPPSYAEPPDGAKPGQSMERRDGWLHLLSPHASVASVPAEGTLVLGRPDAR
jgi:hypothetical protein